MGFLDSIKDTIFGTKSEAQRFAPTSLYTPEQQKLLKSLLEYYQPTVGAAAETYAGERIAPLSEAQVGALGRMSETSVAPYQESLDVLGRFESGEYARPQYLEDYYMKSIEEPLMKRWKEEIMPTIGGEFETRGLFMGSGRREAEVKSAETLMDTLGRSRSDIYARMEDIGRGRQLEATQLKSKTLSDILGLEQTKFAAGEVPRGLEQAGLDVGYQDWLRTQPGTRPQDQILMQLLGLSTLHEPDTIVTPGTEGLLSQSLGPLATLGAAGIMSSSKRFKEDIENIENPIETLDKLQGVSFVWKEDIVQNGCVMEGRDYGFIAEDVKDVLPDIVAESGGEVEGLSYVSIIPFVVEAVKDLQLQVNELKGGV